MYVHDYRSLSSKELKPTTQYRLNTMLIEQLRLRLKQQPMMLVSHICPNGLKQKIEEDPTCDFLFSQRVLANTPDSTVVLASYGGDESDRVAVKLYAKAKLDLRARAKIAREVELLYNANMILGEHPNVASFFAVAENAEGILVLSSPFTRTLDAFMDAAHDASDVHLTESYVVCKIIRPLLNAYARTTRDIGIIHRGKGL